jgi:hypothetical protein
MVAALNARRLAQLFQNESLLSFFKDLRLPGSWAAMGDHRQRIEGAAQRTIPSAPKRAFQMYAAARSSGPLILVLVLFGLFGKPTPLRINSLASTFRARIRWEYVD